MNVLRVQIYQPTTHFRIPFTYKRRHTYPLPPYSTVIGFLINMMGLIDQRTDLFKKLKGLKLSISGHFETKTTEYIWFRNLSKEAHKDKFGSYTNREINGHVQHPGGQSPISIDTLENFYLTLHLWHADTSFLSNLKTTLVNPSNRLEIMHLGRAEDWLVFEDIRFVELKPSTKHKNYHRFSWIPEKCMVNENTNSNSLLISMGGVFYRLPTFATIENYENAFDRHGKRSFEYITTKLNDGIIKGATYLWDEVVDAPVFLADLTTQNKYEQHL